MRLAAEQPWMVALGASPRDLTDDPGKLRSSDVKPRWNLRRCSAAKAFCVSMTCGFTAGYLTPLLRSESQAAPIQQINTFRSLTIPVPSGFQSGDRSGAGRKFFGVDAQTMQH